MGVVVASFVVVGRRCRASERGKSSPKHKSSQCHTEDGCTNLNWYTRTPASYDFLVYFDSLFVTSVIAGIFYLFSQKVKKDFWAVAGTIFCPFSSPTKKPYMTAGRWCPPPFSFWEVSLALTPQNASPYPKLVAFFILVELNYKKRREKREKDRKGRSLQF